MLAKIAYFLFGLLILHAGVTCAKSRFRILDGSLVNMTNDRLGFQALLIYKNNQILCGGTILDELHILTAAHCVEEYEAESITVVVGSSDLSGDAVGHQTLLVSNIKMHEEFGPNKKTAPPNDIALLRLAHPIIFDNEHVAPAVLPKSYQEFTSGMRATISGFGKTKTVSVSPILYKTSVFILTNGVCQRAYPSGLIKNTNICTGHPARVTGFCTGDSGSPLSINGTVIGIASFTNSGCAVDKMAPQVYTRVSEYVDWINRWRGV